MASIESLPSFVSVQAMQEYVVPIQDVLHRPMLPMMRAILAQDHAALQWSRVAADVYTRDLGEGVQLQLDVSSPTVRARLVASSRVLETSVGSAQSDLAALMQRINPVYRHTVAELLHRICTKALYITLTGMGSLVAVTNSTTRAEQTLVYEVYVNTQVLAQVSIS